MKPCEAIYLLTGESCCTREAAYVLFYKNCQRCVGDCQGVACCVEHTAAARFADGDQIVCVTQVSVDA